MGMEMGWALGAVCLLAVIVLFLVGAAAIKYLVLPLTRDFNCLSVSDNPSSRSSARRGTCRSSRT